MALQKPTPVLDVNTTLSHGRFSLEDAFDLRVQAIEIGNASEVLWGKLTDDHKNVLTQIVKRTLEVLHEHTDRYLPNIITGEPGDLIHIGINVLMSKIDEQVDIIASANEFEKDAAKRQMISELMGEIEPLTDDQFVEQIREYLGHGTQVPNSAVERLLDIIEES